jgi:multidrug resistance efflux pump
VIVFLTLCYVAVLAVLVKLKIVRLTLWWKLSPLAWVVLLLIVLIIPMQWGAPAGSVIVYQRVVEIVPDVSGTVIEVPATPMVPMQKGDVLFRIDSVPFEATVEDLEASLALARTRLVQSRELAENQAGSFYDVERYEADIEALEAKLKAARFNLDATVVRAPTAGYPIAVSLSPGFRVSNLPLRSWVSYVVDARRLIVWVHQYQIRHVRPGQDVEVAFKMIPGRILGATVVAVGSVIGQGQYQPSGIAPVAPAPAAPGLFPIVIELDEDTAVPVSGLFGGAVGSAAVYTDRTKFSHVIRRVMIRMEAWLNYVVPY